MLDMHVIVCWFCFLVGDFYVVVACLCVYLLPLYE